MGKLVLIVLAKTNLQKKLQLKVGNRFHWFLAFALVILLGCIKSHVVMIFNLPAPKLPKPIRNPNEFLAALQSQEFKAVVQSQAIMDEYVNPVEYENASELLRRLADVAKINPPRLEPNLDRIRSLLLNGTQPNYVFVGSLLYSQQYFGDDCNLHIVNLNTWLTYEVCFFQIPGNCRSHLTKLKLN